MKKLVLALIMCSVCSAKYIQGEGKFLAHEQDSIAFIKKQLLSNSFKKVIDSELKAMGLDAVAFWDSYNSKFEEHFQTIREGVESKYKKDDEEELSAKDKERMDTELRQKRLLSRSKFGRLDRAIKQYSIKKLSKSVRLPNSHYINVSAMVNQKSLTDIYYRFIGVSQYRSLKKLFLDVSYKLNGTNWIEMGVQTEGDFVNVVNNHWKQKIEESLSGIFVDGVVHVDESSRTEIEARLKQSPGSMITSNFSFIDGDHSGMRDSLHLKVQINISKEESDQELKRIALSFDGGLILTDLKDNSVVSHMDFVKEEQVFDILDQHSLSTNIASLVYRLPMTTIQNIRKVVEENTKITNSLEIVLRGTRNVDEAFSFAKLLKQKGVLYYFEPQVKSMTDREVKIAVNYTGVREKAINVLSSMISQEVSKDRVVVKDGELPFVFNIKDNGLKNSEGSSPSKVNGERG